MADCVRREGSYRVTRSSLLWPHRADLLGRLAPGALYVSGDPLLLSRRAVAFLGEPRDAEAVRRARETGSAIAEIGLTLVTVAERDTSLDCARACLEGGGTVVMATAAGADEVHPPRPAACREIAQAIRELGATYVTETAWGRPQRRNARSFAASLAAVLSDVLVCPAGATRDAMALWAQRAGALVVEASTETQQPDWGRIATATDRRPDPSPLLSGPCCKVARDVSLAQASASEEDDLLPVAACLLSGEALYRAYDGAALAIMRGSGPGDELVLACRDEVGTVDLASATSAAELVSHDGPGLAAGTMEMMGVDGPQALADALACLPRRALEGTVSDVIESPASWLSSADPGSLAREVSRLRPERASWFTNESLSAQRSTASRVGRQRVPKMIQQDNVHRGVAI